MRTLVLFISGFTQSAKRHNGVFDLFEWALAERRRQNVQGARIEYRAWKSDWTAVAEYCQDLGIGRVVIIGYSWGVGWGARKLATRLDRRGIVVPHLLSCDGVYRGRFSRLRSLINSGPLAPKIVVPSNVRRVTWLRQGINKPQGHEIAAANEQRTKIELPTWVDLPHGEIDSSIEFEELAKKAVGRALA